MKRRKSRTLGFESLEQRRLLAAVSIPQTLTGSAGAALVAPVNIDNASGVRAVEIRINFDTSRLDVVQADVDAGSLWTDPNTQVVANVDDATGTIIALVFAANPLGTGAGSLLDVRFTISSSAANGSTTRLDLAEVTINEGAISVTPTPQTGDDSTDGIITFGAAATDTISGVVFADTNLNNQPGATEGIPGVTITLRNTANNQTREVQTDNNGRYTFTGVAAGSYQIVETQPAAFLDGGANQLNVTLTAGQALTDRNFRELGLRPEFVYTRLSTTLALPVGSSQWQTALRKVVTDAQQAATTSQTALLAATAPVEESVEALSAILPPEAPPQFDDSSEPFAAERIALALADDEPAASDEMAPPAPASTSTIPDQEAVDSLFSSDEELSSDGWA